MGSAHMCHLPWANEVSPHNVALGNCVTRSRSPEQCKPQQDSVLDVALGRGIRLQPGLRPDAGDIDRSDAGEATRLLPSVEEGASDAVGAEEARCFSCRRDRHSRPLKKPLSAPELASPSRLRRRKDVSTTFAREDRCSGRAAGRLPCPSPRPPRAGHPGGLSENPSRSA